MSLVNTRLQNFRADSPLDKWEVRASQYGYLDVFQQHTNSNTGIITPDLEQKAIDAVGSTLQIPVLNRQGFTIQNVTQPVAVVGSPSTSALYNVVFVDYYFGFLIHRAQHRNNEISIQREFNRQLRGYTLELMKRLDAAAGSSLELAKTQVLADDLGGRYPLVSNVVVGSLAEQEAIVGDINPLFQGNDFSGMVDVVLNNSADSLIRNTLLEKKQFNEVDKTYQYADKRFFKTNQMPNAAGHKATMMAIQQDSLGMLQQFSPDALDNNTTHNHVWDIDNLPIANMRIGIYQYDGAVDGSGLGGAATAHLTATMMEAYGFHTAVAFLVPYNSDQANNASAIMKLAVATS